MNRSPNSSYENKSQHPAKPLQFSPFIQQKHVYLCPMRKLRNAELHRKTVEQFQEHPKLPIVVVLDNVRSMNNVGSIFRTADAFLVQKLVLCGITGTPPHREITKTAIGAEKSLQWEYEKSTLEAVQKLKAQGYILIAL